MSFFAALLFFKTGFDFELRFVLRFSFSLFLAVDSAPFFDPVVETGE